MSDLTDLLDRLDAAADSSATLDEAALVPVWVIAATPLLTAALREINAVLTDYEADGRAFHRPHEAFDSLRRILDGITGEAS